MRKPKKATPKAGRRRRVTPLWRNRWALRAVAAATLLLVAGGAGWLWHSGWVTRTAEQLKWKFFAVSAEMGFTVQDILVVGRHETSRKDLLAALRLARGAPIFSFGLEEARKRVETLPWVATATVERMLPGTVLLHMVEREPLALWQNKGRFALIDQEGAVIRVDGLERFSELMVVVGDDAPAHAANLLDTLAAQPELLARVEAAARVGQRRWNLRLDNGIDVRLPEEGAASAWARLADYERTHKVMAPDVRVLDLRLPDRLIVRRWGQPETPAARGRET